MYLLPLHRQHNPLRLVEPVRTNLALADNLEAERDISAEHASALRKTGPISIPVRYLVSSLSDTLQKTWG